jgi:hypothetical protein
MTFTNMVYSEFDSTPANVLADIRTVLLSCASVSRPNAATEPDCYKITTTDGADMVFDLNDAAVDAQKMTIAVYKSYDGTTFVDKHQKYLNWRPSGGATTNPIHVIVSVSKEHVFIGVEGPRGPETGAVGSQGSYRSYFAMSALTEYHAGDTPTAVVIGQNSLYNVLPSFVLSSHRSYITRNYDNTLSWEPGVVTPLSFAVAGMVGAVNVQRASIGDGKFHLSPYVFFGDVGGDRGRLKAFHFAGFTQPDIIADAPVTPVGAKTTHDSQLYKFIAVNKGEGAVSQFSYWGPFGAALNSGPTNFNSSVIVAVPCT